MTGNKQMYTVLLFSFVTTIFLYTYRRMNNSEQQYNVNVEPSTWVSMSLCWSENPKIPRKYKQPYILAAQLSALLWRKVTDGEVKVLLTVVYNEDADLEALYDYINTLEKEQGIFTALEKTTSIGECF